MNSRPSGGCPPLDIRPPHRSRPRSASLWCMAPLRHLMQSVVGVEISAGGSHTGICGFQLSTEEPLEPHGIPADLINMDTTANTIEAALRQLHELPTPVSSWLVETGTDSTDDPAIWVWAMLKEDVVDFTDTIATSFDGSRRGSGSGPGKGRTPPVRLCSFSRRVRDRAANLSRHSDLLGQARFLARRDPGRPTQASIRRSASASYYARFHLRVDEATRFTLSGNEWLPFLTFIIANLLRAIPYSPD